MENSGTKKSVSLRTRLVSRWAALVPHRSQTQTAVVKTVLDARTPQISTRRPFLDGKLRY